MVEATINCTNQNYANIKSTFIFTKGYLVNKLTKQSGFAHIIVLTVILAVALIGTLGFVFWQNVMMPKTNVSDGKVVDNVKKLDDKSKVVNTNSGLDEAASSTKGYLVLDDWGVKFKLPTRLGDNEVTYFKGSSYRSEDSYTFSTKKVQNLGGSCAKSDVGLVVLFRSTTTIGSDNLYPNGPVKPSSKVGSFNYYIDPAQMACDEGKDISVQVADRDMLSGLLLSIEKK